MLDAQTIKAMDGAEKLALFVAFAGHVYPGATNAQVADALGYSRRQIQEWRAKPDMIPAIVLLYLQELVNRTDADRPLRAFEAVAEGMEQLAGRLAHLAREMRPQEQLAPCNETAD